jgi:hypothetical protein
MNEVKARYRNKLSKIIIEVWNGEKWLYVKTLSDPLKEFKAECLAKVSLNDGVNTEKDTQKFSQSQLRELQKQDTKSHLVDDMIQSALEKAKEIGK